jgi:TolA-binding protein
MAKKAVLKIDKQKAKETAKAIWPILKKNYPQAKCALEHNDPPSKTGPMRRWGRLSRI